MKIKIAFREYFPPETDEVTGEVERGDYLGSFKKEFEGDTPLAITNEASKFAEDYSKENDVDCRVWEIPLDVTP